MSSDLHQPVSDIQLNQLKIEWVEHQTIHPNRYNPNSMSWHERMLLRQSLLEDGWTQPIVTLPDRTIVDGEQRWTTAGIETTPKDIQDVIDKMEKRQEQGAPVSESILARLHESKARLEAAIAEGRPACIASITGGLVPITTLDLGDDAHKMISTIRHNRARGSHGIDAMASITQDLVSLGLDLDDLETRLGMDDEEIRRFLKAAEGMAKDLEKELAETSFSAAWKPVHISELPEDAQVEYQRSAAAAEAIKTHQVQLAEREAEIARQREAKVQEITETTGRPVTQIEKAKIEAEIAKEIPVPEKPAPVELKKFIVFVTADEYALLERVLMPNMAVKLVELCRQADSAHNN